MKVIQIFIKKYGIAVSIFFLLVIAANLYLFRDGFWFYQDAGYWPKNMHEGVKMLQQQFHSFTNDGFYSGFDRGLFSFTRITITLYTTLLLFFFGYEGSQIAFSVSGYLLIFVSFYLFSGIFFRDKSVRYILSLLYTFNPLSYSLQGHVFYQAIAPLFIYSYHKYFYGSKQLRISYLLLSIFAAFLWVSYIRFIQSNILVIVPYVLYLFFINEKRLSVKKLIVFSFSYFLIFLPIIFSFVSQILEGSQTAFNYGSLLGRFVVQYDMFQAFNLIQSMAPKVYAHPIWAIFGILFFCDILYLLLTFPKKDRSNFYFLNLILVLLGITFYALANIFGGDLYLLLIKLFPFVINEPFWGLYVLSMPLIVLIGLLTMNRKVYLYSYSFLFIITALLPFLQVNDFQLRKFDTAHIPESYYTYFFAPYHGVPEGSYYYPGTCWRASYMDRANTPTLCPNFGYHYPPILIDDPRLISGKTYELSKQLSQNIFVDNYKITHNLKHIFVPNDMVIKKGPGPETGEEEIQKAEFLKEIFDQNASLTLMKNENFNHYVYKDKDAYDYFIYSPTELYEIASDAFYSGKSHSEGNVALVEDASPKLRAVSLSAKVFYKIATNDPTKYYLKITGFNSDQPFALQLNQAFGSSWSIKEISEAEFTQVDCLTEIISFRITNNERCQFIGYGLENNLSWLSRSGLGESTHFQGNYLNNGWVIRPEEVSPLAKETGTLYAVLVYTKQIYFSYTILISIFTLMVLLAFSAVQAVGRIIKKGNHDEI